MVALHRDEVFTASAKTLRKVARPSAAQGLDVLPFNWRLVGAVAMNVALWGGLLAGARALSG